MGELLKAVNNVIERSDNRYMDYNKKFSLFDNSFNNNYNNKDIIENRNSFEEYNK